MHHISFALRYCKLCHANMHAPPRLRLGHTRVLRALELHILLHSARLSVEQALTKLGNSDCLAAVTSLRLRRPALLEQQRNTCFVLFFAFTFHAMPFSHLVVAV
jgi:hypothetical protein